MLGEVCGHDIDLVGALEVSLGHTLAVLGILLVEGNDDSSSGELAGSATTSASSESSDFSFLVMHLEHVFLIAHADASLSWFTFSFSSSDRSLKLVDWDLLNLARSLFQVELVLFQLWEVWRVSPRSAILSINSGSTANVLRDPLSSVEVLFVEDLVNVLFPGLVNHFLSLLFIW